MFNNWFTLWMQDKESILECMHSNIRADLNAGYDPAGFSIQQARADIAAYQEKYNSEFQHLQDIVLAYPDGEKRVNRWCYLDLKRRGAIE